MDDWIDTLADRLGVSRLSGDQTDTLLEAAREVAHGVERRLTPLATFLLGEAVAAATAGGADADAAFSSALDRLHATVDESHR